MWIACGQPNAEHGQFNAINGKFISHFAVGRQFSYHFTHSVFILTKFTINKNDKSHQSFGNILKLVAPFIKWS